MCSLIGWKGILFFIFQHPQYIGDACLQEMLKILYNNKEIEFVIDKKLSNYGIRNLLMVLPIYVADGL